MKKMSKMALVTLLCSILSFVMFTIFTVLLLTVDVRPVGPNGSKIGLATINKNIFDKVGQSGAFDTISDIIVCIAVLTALFFAIILVVNIIKNKGFKNVDKRFYILISSYILVVVLYAIFELASVNKRPVLENGKLVSSYPSTHTLLTVVLLATAIDMICNYVKSKPLKICLVGLSTVLIIMQIISRLLSGMHWFTDIIGGILLGLFVVSLYLFCTKLIVHNKMSV